MANKISTRQYKYKVRTDFKEITTQNSISTSIAQMVSKLKRTTVQVQE